MLNQLSLKLARNYIKDVFLIKFKKEPVLRPLVFAYYVTMRCNFRCSYCDYYACGKTREKKNEFNTEESIQLLKIIRKSCPNIYITGGEPLLREDIVDLLKCCKEIGYSSISMVTNMSLMHKKMEVLNYLDNLTVSLDMVDMKKYAEVTGVPAKIMEQVKKNIIDCARLQREKKFNMTANIVLTEQTMPHARKVIDFCLGNNIRVTLGPQVPGDGTIDNNLVGNKKYEQIIAYVKQARKRSNLIIDTELYLDAISKFKPFSCYPMLTPRVEPDGSMHYPCKPLKKDTANLLKAGYYDSLIRAQAKKYGAIPVCKGTCHMNCYLVPSQLVRAPIRTIREYI